MAAPASDPMEYIWERLPKNPDGKTITYIKTDLAYLYHKGFVDTAKWTFEQWQNALKPFEQDNGQKYILTKQQFFTLKPYRYAGPAHEVFDPYKLRSGPWPDEELEILFQRSIKPSSSVTREFFWNGVNAMKKSGAVTPDGKLVINDSIKGHFAYLLDRFPSARHTLEKEVLRLREETNKKLTEHARNRDASGFTVAKSKQELELASLQKLQGTQTQQATAAQPKDKSPSIDLKSLRKPSSKFRG